MKKLLVGLAVLFSAVFLLFGSADKKKEPEAAVGESAPVHITAEVLEVETLRLKVRVIESAVDSIKKEAVVFLDFSKAKIGLYGELLDESSRLAIVENYRAKQIIDISCAYDLELENNTIYEDGPATVKIVAGFHEK